MNNLLDYIAWRGDLPMAVSPFNEVDNLILSELAYTDLADIVPPPGEGESLSLAEAARAYLASGREQSYLINDPRRALEAAGGSERFGGLRLSAYVSEIDTQRQSQFAAVSFHLADGSCYAAFRGTDNTLVGWREDFNLSYLDETDGQLRALRYLEKLSEDFSGPLRLGGHSKGGNLAIYAAAFCNERTRRQICEVYSNDGPGFNQAVTQTEAYQQSLAKVRLIIPESSLVGILLSNKAERRIVKSSAAGIYQHDPYSWAVLGDRFVEAEKLSPSSALLDEALRRWAEELDDEQWQNLVSAIFDALDASGAETFTQMHSRPLPAYGAVLRALMDMEPQRKKQLREILRRLNAAGKDAARREERQSLAASLKELLQKGREEKKR